ncbi:MAG: hypothetical protein M3680_08660 [Myxococcota bacterium]|nr:hypothetical protein [Myxococcota bacterium]
MRTPLTLCLFTACAAPQASGRATEHQAPPQRPAGDAVAVRETADRSPARTHACADPVLADQVTSGGQRIITAVSCWPADQPAEGAGEAPVIRPAAGAATPGGHRRIATAEAELVQCKGIPEPQLVRSPLVERGAIASLTPIRRGVRLVLERGPQHTTRSIGRAIACHQGRYVSLGRPATYMPDDPTLVDGADIDVTEVDGRVVVTIQTGSEAAGKAVIARARHLTRDRTAER